VNSYTNVFGGESISPSDLSYASYTIGADIELTWPFEAKDGSNVAADKIDVGATASGLSVFLPDATLVSAGQDILVNNVGANSFTVRTFTGATIISVAPGQAWYLYLIDNATQAGGWRIVQFGAGSSAGNAASLAGAGLRANVTLLDQNLPSLVLNGNHLCVPNDRATVIRNNGGAVVYTFNAAGTLGNGWFAYFINGGTGSITLDAAGTEAIDGAPTKQLNPAESCIVFCDGSALWSLGYGRAITSTVTGTSINLAGTGQRLLSQFEVLAQVQDFTGTLTGNRVVEYGTGVGYWFMWNSTSGAFSTTFKVNPVDAGVVVAQGNFAILRSNGTNMHVAFTATAGTVTQIDTAAGEITGGPITGTGTLGLANTAVIAGSYGSPSEIPTVQVDVKGRVVLAGKSPLSIANSVIVSSAVLAGRLSDPTGTASGGVAVFNQAPVVFDAVLMGTPLGPTQPGGTNNFTLATTAFVAAAIAPFAPIVSPIFTGNPQAPTQAASDNDFSIATTAYVTTAVAASPGAVLQSVRVTDNTYQKLSAVIPYGILSPGSVPQITDGFGWLSLVITPRKPTSKIRVTAFVPMIASNGVTFAMALFRNAEPNALSTGMYFGPNVALAMGTCMVSFEWVPGTVTPITLQCRVGIAEGPPAFVGAFVGFLGDLNGFQYGGTTIGFLEAEELP